LYNNEDVIIIETLNKLHINDYFIYTLKKGEDRDEVMKKLAEQIDKVQNK
jgi:hypothetical protein